MAAPDLANPDGMRFREREPVPGNRSNTYWFPVPHPFRVGTGIGNQLVRAGTTKWFPTKKAPVMGRDRHTGTGVSRIMSHSITCAACGRTAYGVDRPGALLAGWARVRGSVYCPRCVRRAFEGEK